MAALSVSVSAFCRSKPGQRKFIENHGACFRCGASPEPNAETVFQKALEHPGVECVVPISLASTSLNGRGIFAGFDAPKGAVLVEIPLKACISVDYSSDSDGLSVPQGDWPRLKKAIRKDDSLPWDILLALGVLDSMAGSGSQDLQMYTNYVLPDPMDVSLPCCLPEHMLDELQDDDMIQKAKVQKSRLANMFPGLSVKMCQDDGPTWLEYAFSCVRSRAFKYGEDKYAFVPILDAANHSLDPNADFSFNPPNKKVILFAMQDIKMGDEITISYSGKMGYANSRMMSQYGFVFSDGNPFDTYTTQDLGIEKSNTKFSLSDVQRALGDGDLMVDIFSGKDATAYACLKSLPIELEENVSSTIAEQRDLLAHILKGLSKRMHSWKSILRDDESMLGHMMASDKSDKRLEAVLQYRILSKRRDVSMFRLLEILISYYDSLQ